MPVSDLTNTAQDYLKVIWSATEWSATPITVTVLAERMGVRPSTVSDGIKRLAERGFLIHAPYGSIELTDVGRAHAVAMARRHRLLETFLVETLGYGWDEVHDEADVLEHAVSDLMINRIDEQLGHPTRDPHGDPIPSADGRPHRPTATQLTNANPGQELTIARISDADPSMLRYFADIGLTPDTKLTVLQRRPYVDLTTVCLVGQTEEINLGSTATDGRPPSVCAACPSAGGRRTREAAARR